MRHIRLYKAQPIGEVHVQSLTIEIDLELPEFDTLRKAEETYSEQAMHLAASLQAVLPQGVLYRLIAILLQKLSDGMLYRGSFLELEPTTDAGTKLP